MQGADLAIVLLRDEQRNDLWKDLRTEHGVALFADNGKIILKGNENTGEYLFANDQLFLIDNSKYGAVNLSSQLWAPPTMSRCLVA